MNEGPFIPEITSIPDEPNEKVNQLLEKVRPQLRKELEELPYGVQYDIQAPPIEVFSAEEYYDAMGFDIDPVGKGILGATKGPLEASPRLGVLNITISEHGSIELEYRSHTGGDNFELQFSENGVEVMGETSVVVEGLSLIFSRDGGLNHNYDTIHVGTRRNLEFFDRDGNPKPSDFINQDTTSK